MALTMGARSRVAISVTFPGVGISLTWEMTESRGVVEDPSAVSWTIIPTTAMFPGFPRKLVSLSTPLNKREKGGEHTWSFMNHMNFHGEMLIIDTMFAGGMKMKLLEIKVLTPITDVPNMTTSTFVPRFSNATLFYTGTFIFTNPGASRAMVLSILIGDWFLPVEQSPFSAAMPC